MIEKDGRFAQKKARRKKWRDKSSHFLKRILLIILSLLSSSKVSLAQPIDHCDTGSSWTLYHPDSSCFDFQENGIVIETDLTSIPTCEHENDYAFIELDSSIPIQSILSLSDWRQDRDVNDDGFEEVVSEDGTVQEPPKFWVTLMDQDPKAFLDTNYDGNP